MLPDHLSILDGRYASEPPPSVYEERELVAPVDLCDARGRLNPDAVGFARRPLWRANLSGAPLRKKRWNFWNWIDPDFVLSLTIADLDYLAFVAVEWIDFTSGESAGGLWPVRPGRLGLGERESAPVSIEAGSLVHENGWTGAGGPVRLEARLRGGVPLRATFAVRAPAGQESLNVVVPWTPTRFQLNSKHGTLPCEGAVEVGGRRFEMRADRTHAVQDWGRGVWPYRSVWNWGVASGVVDGVRLGVNVGARWTTGTGANENGILVDGRLHKLMEDVRWEYDPSSDDAVWRVRTEHSDAIDLTLTPRHAHRVRLPLGLVGTRGVCAFGSWCGTVRVAGEAIAVRDLPGWAEEFAHRW